jgi:aspartate dehydrogenase
MLRSDRVATLKLAVVGCGALGLELLSLIRAEADVCVEAVVVRPQRLQACRELLRPLQLADKVWTQLNAEVDMLIETAGHSAIAQHVVPALRSGVPCVIASVGALGNQELLREVNEAAARGNAQVQLIPGAIGGIDALSAARLCGLDSVVYSGSKPPGAWRGTPAENQIDLERLSEATVFFDGTARDAACLYPKNANVTATIALAGLGFDATRVRLIADPHIRQNIHELQVRGRAGEFEIRLSNFALPGNPRTSALTLYSALRSIRNAVSGLSI